MMRVKVFLLLLLFNITFIYSQPSPRDPIIPDPIDVVGYKGGTGQQNGGNRGNGTSAGNGRNGNRQRLNNENKERKSKVSINGESFMISKETEASLYDFYSQYKDVSNVGGFITNIIAFFAIFDLFQINTDTPELSAHILLNDAQANELIIKLSAPSIWNRSMRAQAVYFCEVMRDNALIKGKENDANAWTRLRDVIANPERYKDGGIKIDKSSNKVILRQLPSVAYRDIAGFDFDLKPKDKLNLLALYDFLMQYNKSRDYIFYADFKINSSNPYSVLKLNERDKLFLNYALLTLSINNKEYLKRLFFNNSIDRDQTFELWNTLKEYLLEEKWMSGRATDSNIDELGFFTDELPEQSDIVTGEYPRQ